MDPLRIYLLLGLVAHKLVWEVLKRGAPAQTRPPVSLRTKLVKAVKVAILLGIMAQTVLPNFLPLLDNPETIRIAGAVLFTAGLAVAIAARLELGKNWSDIEVAGVLKEHNVVSGGIYGLIRHPIYTGDLLLLIGLELALNSWGVVLALALVPIVLRQAISEEAKLIQHLPGYDLYCRRTKRFLPFVA